MAKWLAGAGSALKRSHVYRVIVTPYRLVVGIQPTTKVVTAKSTINGRLVMSSLLLSIVRGVE
jgi:hypothetical protein